MGPELIFGQFQHLSEHQKKQISLLGSLYEEWNDKINVISRKDIDQLYLRHVLHSLSIAKLIKFKPGTEVLDIGTGGGFPGLPLAILFPETHFHLVDSIGKKIKVVDEVSNQLGLENLSTEHQRAEKVKGKFDFIISRAVAKTGLLYQWGKSKIKEESQHDFKNGFLLLKGGDLSAELKDVGKPYKRHSISSFFSDPFFDTKEVIHLPK